MCQRTQKTDGTVFVIIATVPPSSSLAVCSIYTLYSALCLNRERTNLSLVRDGRRPSRLESFGDFPAPLEHFFDQKKKAIPVTM